MPLLQPKGLKWLQDTTWKVHTININNINFVYFEQN